EERARMVGIEREALCAAAVQGQRHGPFISALGDMRDAISRGSKELCHGPHLLLNCSRMYHYLYLHTSRVTRRATTTPESVHSRTTGPLPARGRRLREGKRRRLR